MTAKAAVWTRHETAILQAIYPTQGVVAVADALPHRSRQAIHQRAHKLGIGSSLVNDAPTPKLAGELLDRAVHLHDAERWPLARVAREIGYTESATTNAVLIALCTRKGYRPAERDATGRLSPAGIERLRYMLKKGLRQVEIQLRLGLSASTVSRERQRYNADLVARDKAPLPPPGNGEQYSGVRIPAARRRVAEAAFLEGHGAPTAAKRAGISPAAAKRQRAQLVKRLARRGQCLPGCTIDGRRVGRAQESRHFVPGEAIVQIRERLLAGDPVAHAARVVGIGSCSAYRIRDELRAELEADGRELPRPIRLGRGAAYRDRARDADWLPVGRMQEYRNLAFDHGLDEAKRIILGRIETERSEAAAARRAEAARPKTFAEQLERVRNGAALVNVIRLRRPDPAMTLGGVATGAM